MSHGSAPLVTPDPPACRPGGWVERAACRGQDPELFYPEGTSGSALHQVTAAKEVCGRCPVVSACLQWALDVGEAHGIWGGATPEERRALRMGPAF